MMILNIEKALNEKKTDTVANGHDILWVFGRSAKKIMAAHIRGLMLDEPLVVILLFDGKLTLGLFLEPSLWGFVRPTFRAKFLQLSEFQASLSSFHRTLLNGS